MKLLGMEKLFCLAIGHECCKYTNRFIIKEKKNAHYECDPVAIVPPCNWSVRLEV